MASRYLIMKFSILTLALAYTMMSCQAQPESKQKIQLTTVDRTDLDTATLAGGCFWCIEAALEQIQGVDEVVSGYSGGEAETADYRTVSTGRTKHAEAVQVYYSPAVLSYETLLRVFFTAHDPTQLNYQGPDHGPQYRTAIFYHNEDQKITAEKVMKEIEGDYNRPIVTELNTYEAFYLAESYHQDYERRNPYQPYIMRVSKPKVERVKKTYPDLIKEDH
jgi:peptide-methionine (S)-S-oxide reductase